MSKNVKKAILISSSVIVIVIGVIAIYSWFASVSHIQDEKAIRKYTENADIFENVHDYLSKNYASVNCSKSSIIGRNMSFYGHKLNKSKSESNEIQIDDKLVLQQIEYILYDLDFKQIESIGDHTTFVLRDANDNFQSIDYDTNDLTKIKDWNSTRLKDNWYYRSFSISSVKPQRPPDE